MNARKQKLTIEDEENFDNLGEEEGSEDLAEENPDTNPEDEEDNSGKKPDLDEPDIDELDEDEETGEVLE